jgi:hypothetical protein
MILLQNPLLGFLALSAFASGSCTTIQRTMRVVVGEANCATIVSSTFEYLHVAGWGAAIYVFSTSTSAILISGCNFYACSAAELGGAVSAECQEAILRFCYGAECHSYSSGGLIELTSASSASRHTLSEVAIWGCSAANGGGGLAFGSNQNVGASGVNFTDCEAPSYGGALDWLGISTPYFPAAILYSVFRDNSGRDCVCSYSRGLVTFESCAFINNVPTRSLLWAYRAPILVQSSVFQGNSGSPFYREPGSNGFLVYDCVLDYSTPAGGTQFSDTARNSWNCETGIELFSQTRTQFTDPGFSAAWVTVPSADVAWSPESHATDPDHDPSSDRDESPGLGSDAIAGIVLGTVAFGVLFVSLFMCCRAFSGPNPTGGQGVGNERPAWGADPTYPNDFPAYPTGPSPAYCSGAYAPAYPDALPGAPAAYPGSVPGAPAAYPGSLAGAPAAYPGSLPGAPAAYPGPRPNYAAPPTDYQAGPPPDYGMGEGGYPGGPPLDYPGPGPDYGGQEYPYLPPMYAGSKEWPQ